MNIKRPPPTIHHHHVGRSPPRVTNFLNQPKRYITFSSKVSRLSSKLPPSFWQLFDHFRPKILFNFGSHRSLGLLSLSSCCPVLFVNWIKKKNRKRKGCGGRGLEEYRAAWLLPFETLGAKIKFAISKSSCSQFSFQGFLLSSIFSISTFHLSSNHFFLRVPESSFSFRVSMGNFLINLESDGSLVSSFRRVSISSSIGHALSGVAHSF